MDSFPNATVARIVTRSSRTFPFLVQAAEKAIFESMNRTRSYAEIDYNSIDDDTHKEFHTFISSMGYIGDRRTKLDGDTIYQIRWHFK